MSDALGSVRQISNTGGAIVLAKSYDPYGISNSSSGTTQTSYGFTGEQTDPTGMVYLRARYYAPGTGRFMSRDTWGGDVNRPMSYNRWNYTDSNPVNRLDPSGQCWVTPPGSNGQVWLPDDSSQCSKGYDTLADEYGISFSGAWAIDQRGAVFNAVQFVGAKLSTVLGGSSSEAFKRVYHYGVDFLGNASCKNCHDAWCETNNKNDDGKWVLLDKKKNKWGWSGYEKDTYFCSKNGGYTHSGKSIEFATLEGSYERMQNNVVHELGHAFNRMASNQPVVAVQTANLTIDCWPQRGKQAYAPKYGFASAWDVNLWQMHYAKDDYSEEFADMYLGWVFSKWETYPLKSSGDTRSNWMNEDEHMKLWAQMATQ